MLIVKFSCKGCGLADEELAVPYRKENQDVCDYVKNTLGEAIGLHHMLISPNCKAAAMDNVKIPVPKSGEGIGMKP